MLECLVFTAFILYVAVAVFLNILKIKSRTNEQKIAFFHPFCNDGGGGQKVLWCIIQALLNKKNFQTTHKIAIYSLEQNKDAILQKVKNRFSVDLSSFKDNIDIIYVSGRNLLVPQRNLTMVFHMILPAFYALRCLIKYQPDVFYDTTGFASTLVLAKLLLPTTKTAAYVHYPFISLDMIQKVKQRKADFNNDASISNSPVKTKLKIVYYQVIFILYKINGYFIDFAQTNSSWTHNHMKEIWKNLDQKNKLVKLYPPCSVKDLARFEKKIESDQILMMSLAQFRPEKNHKCQINTVKKIVDAITLRNLKIKPKLYICGTTRGDDDEKILQQLKILVEQLRLQNYVEFKVNKPFTDILKYIEQSLIGIHTMEAQHFGISVVQMLAGGLIVVAHNSAGPRQDIIRDQRFLATKQEDYFQKIMNILASSAQQKTTWIKQNRKKAQKFGQEAFQRNFSGCLVKQLEEKGKNE